MRLLFLTLLAGCATAPAAKLPSTAASEPARASFGCRVRQPIVQGDRTLSSGGRTRRFRLVVPKSAEQGPAPLVLNIHGLVETAGMQQFYSDMDARAAERGMVVVYPQGVGNSWNAGKCCGRAMDERVDDVRYLRDLVRELSSELCIDRARVYSTGMSNGAIMSYRLACDAPDLIAAIAPVAGVEAAESCKPSRPVPILAFNGTSDLLVHYDEAWFDLEPATVTAAKWRERNRCSATPASVYRRGDTVCEAPSCAADTILCRIEGGGHTWPGAIPMPFLGHTSSDVDSTSTMLDFFLAHPLQKNAGPGATGRALARSASGPR